MKVKTPDLLTMITVIAVTGVFVTTALQARTIEPHERFTELTKLACTVPAASTSLRDLPC